MRRALKFLHTLASSGIIGGLLGYMVVLVLAPQATPVAYADVRQTIVALCNYIILPSLALALVSGLLAMAAHRPFFDTRWAWIKALLGLMMFEATLGLVQAKATAAAAEATKITTGQGEPGALAEVLANEWLSLGALMALSIAQVALGVWRPRLSRP